MAEFYAFGFAAMLAADADDQVFSCCAAFGYCDLYQFTDAFLVKGLEGVAFQDALFYV